MLKGLGRSSKLNGSFAGSFKIILGGLRTTSGLWHVYIKIIIDYAQFRLAFVGAKSGPEVSTTNETNQPPTTQSSPNEAPNNNQPNQSSIDLNAHILVQ